MNQRGQAVEETLKLVEELIARNIQVSELVLKKKIGEKVIFKKLGEISEAQFLIESGEYSKDFPIGVRVEGIRLALKGYGHYAVSPEQAKRAEELGLLKPKVKIPTITDKLLDLVELLIDQGIDLKNIAYTRFNGIEQTSTTLRDLPGVEKIIKEYALDPEYPIGRKICILRTMAKGNTNTHLSEEQILRAKRLGLLEEREHNSVIEETLRIVELLTKAGIDCAKLKLSYMMEGKQKYITLGEISGAEEIIKENNLDKNYPIGKRINNLKQGVRGKIRCIITEEQKKRVRELGIVVDNKESVISKILKIVTILANNGIDVSSLPLSKIENGEQRFLRLKDIPGIDKIIDEYGLDGNLEIGRKILALRQAAYGKCNYKITSEDIEVAINLGLISRLKVKLKEKTEAQSRRKKAKELCEEYSKLDDKKIK